MDFKCIAGKCRHNCCIGWEIDIDEGTYLDYMDIEGSFGDRLRSSIVTAEDEDGNVTHSFKLDKNARCPFLNSDNLCDIILTLGEEWLCDICTEHPRFYKEIDGCECVGYGLCCEAAAEMILFGNDSATGNSLPKPCNTLKSDSDIIRFCNYLLTLERLDNVWAERIEEFRDAVLQISEEKESDDRGGEFGIKGADNIGIDGLEKIADGEVYITAFSNLYNYLLFRYDDIEYASCMQHFIAYLFAHKYGDGNEPESYYKSELIEICREYSSEIEYSDVNAVKIMEYVKYDY